MLDTGDLNRFIEKLPHTLGAPAQLDFMQGDDPAQWCITVTLAPTDQAALDALRPSAYQLCASAQHALGLAAIGSQLDPAHVTVRVRAGDGLLLAFVGAAALWWVATMPPAAMWGHRSPARGDQRAKCGILKRLNSRRRPDRRRTRATDTTQAPTGNTPPTAPAHPQSTQPSSPAPDPVSSRDAPMRFSATLGRATVPEHS